MQQTKTPQQYSYFKVKGISWLIDKENIDCQQQKRKEVFSPFQKQDKKWKKQVANRFEGYSKTIEKFVQTQFKKENQKQNTFEFNSLRKTQSNFIRTNKKKQNFQSLHDNRQGYELTIFDLRKKERYINNQVFKMKKLKEMSEICEKKKNFYDDCVDQYFQNYRKDINRTITKLADRSTRDSKAKINRS